MCKAWWGGDSMIKNIVKNFIQCHGFLFHYVIFVHRPKGNGESPEIKVNV